MPSTTDLYFTLEDSRVETALMPNAELRPIRWTGGTVPETRSIRPEDEAVIRQAVQELLAA